MTNTTVDRFQLLSVNELTYPHKCATCGSFTGSNGKMFIDFGLFVEFYGNVYICTGCFYGAIKSLQTPSDESQDRILELQAVVTTLVTENRTLRDAMDNLRSSIVNRPNPDSDSANVVPSESVETGSDRCDAEPEVSSPDPIGLVSVGETPQLGSSESNDVEGSTDVRTNDSSVIGLEIFKL